MRDQLTGRSRGFGFVKFMDPTAIDRVTTTGPHFVDGKRVDPKPAIPKQNVPAYDMRYVKRGSNMESNPKKIFVGGLSQSITSQDLRNFFEPRFGPVVDTQVMMDKETDRSRGFGFVTFEDGSSVDQVFEQLESASDGAPAFFSIDGHPIDVKRAIPRSFIHRNTGMHPHPSAAAAMMSPMALPMSSMPLSTMSLSTHTPASQSVSSSAPSLNIITSTMMNPQAQSNVAAFMPMTPLSAFYSPLDWQRNFNMAASPLMIPSPSSTAFHFPVSAEGFLTTAISQSSVSLSDDAQNPEDTSK